MESPEIRVTTISPGLIATELEDSTPDEELRKGVKEFHAEHAIPASTIADAIAYAIGQPDSVDVNELVVRPTTQELLDRAISGVRDVRNPQARTIWQGDFCSAVADSSGRRIAAAE